MKLKYLIISILLLVVLVAPVFAGDLSKSVPITDGVAISRETTQVKLEQGDVTLSTTTGLSPISVRVTTLINNIKFIPDTTATTAKSLSYQTRGSTSVFSYQYNGNTLKETIVLKGETAISFQITPSKGSKFIPWFNGEYKVVREDMSNTMDGIVAQSPTGVDAAGYPVPMSYKWDEKNSVLSLVYDKTLQIYNDKLTKELNKTDEYGNIIPQYDTIPVTYPLTIDPTWVSYLGHWIDNTTLPGEAVEMWNTTGVTNWTAPTGVTSVWYLVIAGGGGAGGHKTHPGGGGGAGGLLNGTLTVTPGIVYNLTVGSLGLGGTGDANPGGSGINSSFANTTAGDGINAKGGGGGGSSAAGLNGGSGGGGSDISGNRYAGGTGITGQGYAGGYSLQTNAHGGGGGGAGARGNSTNTTDGGIGLQINITGVSTYYSGGGGGGYYGSTSYDSYGGLGGGGNAPSTCPSPYHINGGNATYYGGGGGGGCTYTSVNTNGGNGYSGIVILRYTTPGGGGSAPTSTFTKDKNLVTFPKRITVTDTSTNTPTQWNWSWGDGTWTNGTTQNPTHQYLKRGMWSVSLLCSNAYGSNTSASQKVRVVGQEQIYY
jgi:hypothetical protein